MNLYKTFMRQVLLAVLGLALMAPVWAQHHGEAEHAAQSGGAVSYRPDVTFTLRTAIADGKLVFVGDRGPIDKQVNPERVRELYADFGSPKKVFVDLACSSHNAMWEKNHLLLFRASLEWLTKESVEGKQEGMIRLGY